MDYEPAKLPPDEPPNGGTPSFHQQSSKLKKVKKNRKKIQNLEQKLSALRYLLMKLKEQSLDILDCELIQKYFVTLDNNEEDITDLFSIYKELQE